MAGVAPYSSFKNPNKSRSEKEKERLLALRTTESGTLFSDLDFTGSDLSSIVTKAHNGLTSIDGGTTGQYYHLTLAQHTIVSAADAGVYTPTLTNVANVAASTAYECQYMRIGTVVTVSGKVDIDVTLTATATQLGLSLPIASNLGAAEDCSGVAFAPAIAGLGAAIYGDTTNDVAQIEYISTDIANRSMYFVFSYAVI